MPSTASNKRISIPADPDLFSGSLAHVVLVADGEDRILGQAWKVGDNMLITCGHVVEQYTRNPASLTVKFPASGNRYIIKEITLHPSFGKKQEQLVKFDIAKLTVELHDQEAESQPLPITYEKEIYAQQPLSALRYASHLEQITTSLSPLAQVGSYLGPLKKNDRFHMLHDLALSPGDSGTALFDGQTVVAIHCGDTATLPGLNLPTTSIRLALSTDALLALGVPESSPTSTSGISSMVPAIVAFLVCTLVAFGITSLALVWPQKEPWTLHEPNVQPILIDFIKPLNKYTDGEKLAFRIDAKGAPYVYMFLTRDSGTSLIYPPPGSKMPAKTDRIRSVDFPKSDSRVAIDGSGELHIIALDRNIPPIDASDYRGIDPTTGNVNISRETFEKTIKALEESVPEDVLHQKIVLPQFE